MLTFVVDHVVTSEIFVKVLHEALLKAIHPIYFM